MKIRGLLAGLLVAVSLAGCARSATAPEAPTVPVVATPSFETATTPPPDTTTASSTNETTRSGGAMGSGN